VKRLAVRHRGKIQAARTAEIASEPAQRWAGSEKWRRLVVNSRAADGQLVKRTPPSPPMHASVEAVGVSGSKRISIVWPSFG